MSISKYSLHLLVLPEDQASQDIVNGFVLRHQLNPGLIQVLPCADGWPATIEKFNTNFVPTMGRYENRWFVLLIDFWRLG
ncbi:MAG: hypothetical protein ACUVSQ_04235 [Pseudanabaenaceae cyanobacterium]